MHVPIVAIGNSRGIRIPASILQECGADAFDLQMVKGQIVLKPIHAPRAAWEVAFAADGNNNLVLPEALSEDVDGWDW